MNLPRPTLLKRRMTPLLLAMVVGCATRHATKPRCAPACRRNYDGLDEALLRARKPLLRCVALQGRRSNLHEAHICFRALRQIESARWWLDTLIGDTGWAPRVYRAPSESALRRFFCAVALLARAETAEEVERRYLEVVRAYP